MILEQAVLDVKPGLEREFETSFAKAQEILRASPGYLSHELQRCLDCCITSTIPSRPWSTTRR